MGSPGPPPAPADAVAAQCRQFYERRLRAAESFREANRAPAATGPPGSRRNNCTPRLATAMQRLRQQIATLISEDNALFRQLLELNDSIASLREQQLRNLAELSRASSLESFSAAEDDDDDYDDELEYEVHHHHPQHPHQTNHVPNTNNTLNHLHNPHHHHHHHHHHHDPSTSPTSTLSSSSSSSSNNNNNNNNSNANNNNSSNSSNNNPFPPSTVGTQTTDPPSPSLLPSTSSRPLQIVTRDGNGRLVVLRPGKSGVCSGGYVPSSSSSHVSCSSTHTVRLNASSCPYDSGFQGSESDADNNEIFV